MFCESTWNVPGFDVVFEAAPFLKHADEVIFYGYSLDETVIAANSEAFMRNFVGMKSLRLGLDNEAFSQFSWRFLRREATQEIRRIELVGWPSPATEDMSRSVEELVHECAALPRLQSGKVSLELDFSAKLFSGAFGLRIIELLKDSRREVTFQMILQAHDELILDESEYSVDDDGTTKRYASEQNGIFVEVDGGLITIKSKGEVSATKRSRGRNEHASPVISTAD
ncbi:hypothetical protein AAVH_38176 [Aphelenchoides avenae]|nr:hypothetical protein AAVH_38176 [Aphelenchus avenae]